MAKGGKVEHQRGFIVLSWRVFRAVSSGLVLATDDIESITHTHAQRGQAQAAAAKAAGTYIHVHFTPRYPNCFLSFSVERPAPFPRRWKTKTRASNI